MEVNPYKEKLKNNCSRKLDIDSTHAAVFQRKKEQADAWQQKSRNSLK